MGRKWPACVFCTDASQTRDSRPISSASAWGIHWPLRRRAWQRRAFSYVALDSNQGQFSVAQFFHNPMSLSVSTSRNAFTLEWPGRGRRYSWMPSSAKAHARGEEKDSTTDSPRSKSWADNFRWPSLRERPAPVPAAQSARAWLSSVSYTHLTLPTIYS